MDVGCQSPGNKARRTIKEQTSRACVVLAKRLNQPTSPLWFKCDTFSKWRKCEHLGYYVAWFEPIRRAIWWHVKANLHPRLEKEYHANEGPFMKRHKLQSRKDKNIERVDLRRSKSHSLSETPNCLCQCKDLGVIINRESTPIILYRGYIWGFRGHALKRGHCLLPWHWAALSRFDTFTCEITSQLLYPRKSRRS